jgi:hypothetical protein
MDSFEKSLQLREASLFPWVEEEMWYVQLL